MTIGLLVLSTACYSQQGAGATLPLRSRFEKVHGWGSQKTFLWEVSTQYKVDEDGRVSVYKAVTTLCIARLPGRTYVTGDAFGLSPIGLRRDALKLLSEKGWVLDASEGLSRVVVVWPLLGDILSSVNSCRYEAFVFPPGGFFYGYFAATNPLTWLDVEWQVSRSDGRWLILRPRHVNSVSAVLYPEVNARLTLSRLHGNAPAKLEMDYGGIKSVYETTKFMNIEGIWVPAEAKYKAIAHSRRMYHESTFRLLAVSDTRDATVNVPFGAQVNDFRLGAARLNYQECISAMANRKNVTYFWDGKLPDPKELKHLALMQGKLPPTERVVRFSWWLIVPGIALIIWSLFAYWRWRRSVATGEG
jgi:hypothetical protein